MFWFCKHDWEIKDKVEKRPAAEKAERISGLYFQSEIDAVFKGSVVWLVQCKKCKRIKSIKEII